MKTVFISSTSADLHDYREAVVEAINQMKLFHPIKMEDFGSQPGGASKVSLGEVKDADIFVGIIAQRYGSVPKGGKISITEQEYDEACQLEKPRLMYFLDPKHRWPKERIENDPIAQRKLAAFRAKIEANDVRSLFTTRDNLARKVVTDLNDWQRKNNTADESLSPAENPIRAGNTITTGDVPGTQIIGDHNIVNPPEKPRDWTLPIILGLILAFIATAAAVMALIPDTQRNPILLTLGLIQPTPMEGATATSSEILVVVTKFTGDYDPQIDLEGVIQKQAKTVGNIRVISVGHSISTPEEAQAIGALYNATLVVYGHVKSGGGATVHYEITRQKELLFPFSNDLRVSASQVKNFDEFLYEGLDINYIDYLIAGQLYYFKGDYSDAITAFDSAVAHLDTARASDLSADVLYRYRGNADYGLGKLDLALAEYKQALSFNGQDANIFYDLGLVYSIKNSSSLALDNFDQAIKLNSAFVDAYIGRGGVYNNLPDYDKELADYNQAITLDPQYAVAYLGRGIAQYNLGSYDLALADYNQAITLNSNYANAYFNRGQLYEKQGDDASNQGDMKVSQDYYSKAIDDYNKAINIDPNYSIAYYNRAVIYTSQQAFTLALDDLNHAITTNSLNATPDADAYIQRGFVNSQLSRLPDAASDYYQYVTLTASGQPVELTIDLNNEAFTSSESITDGAVYRFSFQAYKGKTLNASATSQTDSTDPLLILLDTNGEPIIANDDIDAAGNAAIKEYVIPADGNYVLVLGQGAAHGMGNIDISLYLQTSPDEITPETTLPVSTLSS